MKRELNRRERIQYIHDRIAEVLPFHSYKYNPGYWAIAEELGVTMQTIQADAAFMRDELGLPLEYDQRDACLYYRGGWNRNSDVFNLADTLANILIPS